MLFEIDILNGEMVLLDEDGNSYECVSLTTYRAAKRTVQAWSWCYVLNVADAYWMVAVHFAS